jgi:hypothetical protein
MSDSTSPPTSSDITADAVSLMRAQEQVRQERDAFNSQLQQYRRMAVLRFAMGCIALGMLPLVAIFCWWLIVHSSQASSTTKEIAAATLLIDVIGLVTWIWRGVVGTSPVTQVSPVTTGAVADIPSNGES